MTVRQGMGVEMFTLSINVDLIDLTHFRQGF